MSATPTLNVDDILVPFGTAYVAPQATAVPTDPFTAVSGSYTDLGSVFEDGLVEGISEDVTEIKLWSGATARKLKTSFDRTFQITFLETNPDVLEVYYGDYTDLAGFGQVRVGKTTVRRAWIFDMADGSKIVRVCVPDGEITEHGEVVSKSDEARRYQITITAYPDASGYTDYIYVQTETAS